MLSWCYEQASLPAKNWIENQLLPRLDNSLGVVAVIAGQQIVNKSRAPLADEMKLEPITKPSDWLEYSRRKWQSNVKLDHIEALTLATNGNPGQLSALLETMMTGLKANAGA